jgi:hypothetical protein
MVLIEDRAGRLQMFPAKAIQTHVALAEPTAGRARTGIHSNRN